MIEQINCKLNNLILSFQKREISKEEFINQSGHALYSIGTVEAINVIKELSVSKDPVIRDEILYRLSKIEEKNDYERNYDLTS